MTTRTSQHSNLLPHLAAVLKEQREASGVTLRGMEDYGRERSSFFKLESHANADGPVKMWPNLDEFVTAYSAATGVEPATLWTRAIRRMRDS